MLISKWKMEGRGYNTTQSIISPPTKTSLYPLSSLASCIWSRYHYPGINKVGFIWKMYEIITRKFLIWQVGSGQIQTPSSLHLTNISRPFTSNSSRSLEKNTKVYSSYESVTRLFFSHLMSFSPSSFFSRLTKAHLELNLSVPVFRWTI